MTVTDDGDGNDGTVIVIIIIISVSMNCACRNITRGAAYTNKLADSTVWTVALGQWS